MTSQTAPKAHTPSSDQIRRAPKVLLHDHLDGGLRPGTIVELARECAEDLAEDGVVYAEVRYAPEQHLEGGLTLEQVVEAVNEGFREGERIARENGHRIRVGALLTAMRHAARPGGTLR